MARAEFQRMRPTKSSIMFILLALCSADGFSQHAEWLDHYQSSGTNLGFRFCPGTNGELFGLSRFTNRVIMGDDTITALANDDDLLVVKWDSAGTILWSRVIDNSWSDCYPGMGSDRPIGLQYNVTQDLLLVVQRSTCSYPSDVFTSRSHLVAYTGAGDHLWTRSMGAGQNTSVGTGLVSFTDDQEIGVSGSASGVVSFTGTTMQLPTGHFMIYYDVNGTFLQGYSLPLSNGGFRLDQRTDSTYLFSLNATPSTLFYGQSLPVIAANEGVILRSDTAGSIIWSTIFRSSMECYMSRTTEAHGLIATIVAFSGDLLVPGIIPNTGLSPRALAILSAQGDVLSLTPITSNEHATFIDLKIGEDGSVYLFMTFGSEIQIGNSQFIGQASRNGLIARLNSAGECLSGWSFGRIFANKGGGLMPFEDAVYVSMGIDSTLTIGYDVIPLDGSEFTKEIFVAKYAAIDGFTSLPPLKSATNNQLLIYANPNDGTCTIELPDALEWTPDLILRIHDSQGRLIQSMPLRKEQGRIAMDIRAHAKGIYPVEVTDGQQRYTGTIIFQ